MSTLHAVLWIDHQHAQVLRLQADSTQLQVRGPQGTRALVPINSLGKAQLVAIFGSAR